jgi:hypothetical protein
MRNMVDPNLTPDAVQTNGAETEVPSSNSPNSHSPDSPSNDSQSESVLRSTGGCPYHAMLEQLGIWQE